MARVTINPPTLVGPYPTLQPTANSLDVAVVAADATNFNQTPWTGREILYWRNTGAGARTVTISARLDAQNRDGPITAYSSDAGEIGHFSFIGPNSADGWKQADGMIYFQASHAEVVFWVVRAPA